METGISSFTFGWCVGVEGFMPASPLTEQGLVKLAVQFGVSRLQIGDNLPLHSFSSERLDTLRTVLTDASITIEIGARGLTEANLERYIDLCRFFKSPLLRFVIDDQQYHPSADTVSSIIRNSLPALLKNQIILGIENHDRFRAVELAELMNKLDSPATGICLDCVNSLGAAEGLEHVATTLAPYTVNLHVKDFIIYRLPHKMGFKVEGARAGTGMTDIPWLLTKLRPYGRCMSAILEQWVPPEKTIDETWKKEMQWAEDGIQHLKQLIIKHNN